MYGAAAAVLCTLGATSSLACAQEPSTEDPEATIRWRLGDDGRVEIGPDPAIGADEGWRTVGDPTDPHFSVWQSLGLPGFGACLLSGDRGLLATTDALRFFERLDVDDDAIVRRLGSPPGSDAPRDAWLRYQLAIHAAADRGLKPALGPLRQLLRDGVAPSPACRVAAEDAVAVLNGEASPDGAPAPDLPGLEAFLATVPSDAQAIAVVDQTRVPPSRPLFGFGRVTGLAMTRHFMAIMGGDVSPATLAGAHMMSEGPSLVGYEIARRYGDHRIVRTCAALRFPATDRPAERTRGWIRARFDGRFDVAALRAGLREDGIDPGDAEDVADVNVEDVRLRVVADHANLEAGTQAPSSRMLEAAIREDFLATCASVSAPIRFRILGLPAEVADTVFDGTTPEFLALTVPRRAEDPIVARLRFRSEADTDQFAGYLAAGLEACTTIAGDDTVAESVRDAARSLRAAARFAKDPDAPRWISAATLLPAVDLEELATFVAWRSW